MKKLTTVGCLFSAIVIVQAQVYDGRVGINTKKPITTLDVSRKDPVENGEERAQGVSFPNFTTEERSKFRNVKIGTIVYNTSKECLEVVVGPLTNLAVIDGNNRLTGNNIIPEWKCVSEISAPQNTARIDIANAGVEGEYIRGVALTNDNKVKFTLTNNSFYPVQGINLTSAVSITNANGQPVNVTATGQNLASVNIAGGEKITITYLLSGTPEEDHLVATFDRINLVSAQNIHIGKAQGTIKDKVVYVFSHQYDGKTFQGKMNNGTNKISFQIPYSNGRGNFSAFTSSSITTASGLGGDVNDISLHIPAGSLNGLGMITGEIEVKGDQEHLVRLLTPSSEYDIATIPATVGDIRFQVKLVGTGGVKDKQYEANNGHKYMYVPVQAADGSIWLNNNLGAEYSNRENEADYNPAQQATSITDHKAYGNMFQWGRPADGHEIMVWSSSTVGRVREGHPAWYGKFDLSKYSTFTENCPMGWHTPTKIEQQSIWEAMGNTGNRVWNDPFLKLPPTGYIDPIKSAYAFYAGVAGRIWSKDRQTHMEAWVLAFDSADSFVEYRNSWFYGGVGIRCRKD